MTTNQTTGIVDTTAYRQLKTIWERNWTKADFAPSWIITQIPQELQEAVETRWFPSHAPLLDIGCGSGELSAWLTKQGFTVLGVDFSAAAIMRAEADYGNGLTNLAFQVADMCNDGPTDGQFQVLFDRGCLHGLPKSVHANYAQTVAQWALPGARFLLLCGYNQQARRPAAEEYEMQKMMEAHLEALFQPYFVIHKMVPTFLERSLPHEPVPALAVWMERY